MPHWTLRDRPINLRWSFYLPALPLGMYSNSTASSTCENCPPGYYTDSTGSSNCTICEPGRFSQGGAGACAKCTLGWWSDAGATECYECPVGTYSDGQGCIPCPDLKFTHGPGSSTCLSCDKNQYPAWDRDLLLNNRSQLIAHAPRCKDCIGVFCSDTGKVIAGENEYLAIQADGSVKKLTCPGLLQERDLLRRVLLSLSCCPRVLRREPSAEPDVRRVPTWVQGGVGQMHRVR